MKHSVRTTLWDVISAIQARLERHGLDPTVVDSAVVLGVETMLAGPSSWTSERAARRSSGRLGRDAAWGSPVGARALT